jgi:hypothetical protein
VLLKNKPKPGKPEPNRLDLFSSTKSGDPETYGNPKESRFFANSVNS